MPTSFRIGTFFLLIGLGLVVLFIYSDVVKAPQYEFLLYGALGMLLGMALRGQANRPPPPESTRFRMLRKQSKKDHKKAE
ncbi:MAG TPA: hypothetical protein VHO48_08240 [Anaerolineaceae bacterium]|nr:hypothetical protein [Anaerolineaceae bacterium]